MERGEPGTRGELPGGGRSLSRVHVEYLDRLTEEINDSADDMVYGEFVLNEFVDRFGPRLAHLNGVIQTLAQLSSPAETATAEP